jgi:hypothetical protein
MTWHPFDGGASIGETGTESGTILADEEHADGARITLEEGFSTAPFAITCGVYGWMVHTRLFGTRREAERQYSEMKVALSRILAAVPAKTEDLDKSVDYVSRMIGDFVAEFP